MMGDGRRYSAGALTQEVGMSMFDELKDKAQKAAADHPDQVEKVSDQAIERGGDFADKRTDGSYASQVDGAQEKADNKIGE
jgi:hypothetical protein